MALSHDYVVEQLCARMGSGEPNYGIDWKMNGEGGFSTVVNGVKLYIIELPTGGASGVMRIFLTLLKNGKKADIIEPLIHFSQAPIGKFLRAASRFLEIQKFSPRDPETSEEKANERLRIALNKLYISAYNHSEQHGRVISREEYLDIKKELDSAITSEESTQELLRCVAL